MFLRALKTRHATPVASPETGLEAKEAADETLDYYTRETPQGPLREVTPLEQLYGYWSRE